jgi:hypothetical protein
MTTTSVRDAFNRFSSFLYLPSPSLSNRLKASLNSAICSSVNWSAIVIFAWCVLGMDVYKRFYDIDDGTTNAAANTRSIGNRSRICVELRRVWYKDSVIYQGHS